MGNAQLTRYLAAATSYSQNFTRPLLRGYNFSTYYIPYSATTYLKVSSTSVAGLIFYDEVPISNAPPGYVPVMVPFPEAKKDYQYQLKPIPVGTLVAGGISIVCIAGGLYFVATTGDPQPLEEGLRNLGKLVGAN